MEKKELILLLKEKLRERGIDGAFLERQMSKIEMLLDAEVENTEYSGETENFDYITPENIDGITDELYALLARLQNRSQSEQSVSAKKSEEDGAEADMETDENAELLREYRAAAGINSQTREIPRVQETTQSPHVRDIIRTRDVFAGETAIFERVTPGDDNSGNTDHAETADTAEQSEEIRAYPGRQDNKNLINTQIVDAVRSKPAKPSRQLREDDASLIQKVDVEQISFTEGGEAQDYPLPETVGEEEAFAQKPRGTPLFWTLFAFSSPFLLILAIIGAAGFAGGFFVMALLIAVSFAALVSVVAAGTATALIEIIYGITQLFEYVPIGLCEIGIGIMIAGAVMLSGILIYNAAVRLLPFLIKKFARLLKLSIIKVRMLYYFLKGECAKL